MNVPIPPGVLTDEEFATIQAAGGPQAAPPKDRDFMAAQVNQYRMFRLAAPRPEDISARTSARAFLDKLTLDPDNIAAANGIDLIAKAPPEQQAATRDRLVIDSWLTERLSAQTIIAPDGSIPRPELDPMRRDELRDALAQDLFGDNAPRGSDAAVIAQLRTKADERRRHRVLIGGQDGTDDAAKAATSASLARWAARSAYAGESAVTGFAKWKQQARNSPNWTPIADKQALFEAWADVYGETKTRVAPYQTAVRQTLEGLKQLAAERDDFGTPEQFDAAVAPLLKLDEQTLRTVALPALRSMAELDTAPEGGGSFWDKMSKSFFRVFGQGAAGLSESMQVVGAAQGVGLANNPLAAFGLAPFSEEDVQKVGAAVVAKRGENLVRTMVRNVMTTDIDPIKPSSEGPVMKRLEQMAYDVAGTAAYMTMLSVPYAGSAMATASFADSTTAMLLDKHPDMNADDARAIATIAAPIQTGIEQLQRLQVFGKVPVFNKAMNWLAGPGGNAAVRFGLYGVTGTLVEYGEEKLQDAAPLAVQSLAAALKQDIPQANLDGFEAFELRTFLAVAPFALIGAGVNVAQDKAAMRLLVTNDAAMRAVGMSEDGIQAIQAATTVEAQTQAIQAAWNSRDTTAPADARWQETVQKAAAEQQAQAMKEAQAMQQAAGVQQVQRVPGGAMHITLADGTVAIAADAVEGQAIIEAATEAAQGWDNVQALTNVLNALDARPDAPTRAIDAIIEQRPEVADEITRLTDIANDETLQQDERDAAANSLQSIFARGALYEQEEIRQAAAEGRDPNKIDWRKVTIAGQSAMEVRDGVATAVIRVDKGASPYVVLEETVEADFKAMERAGEMSQADAVAELRDLERRTGDAYLSGYKGDAPAEDRLAVVEALSKAARIYATGTVRAGGPAGSRVAGVLRETRKAQRGKLMQAERDGVAPKVIAYLRQKAEWLKAVIGQAIRLNRARRAARDAGETFPLERFLQRVTGVAPTVQAAEEVTDAAAEVWDDAELSSMPPDDDELTPFSFQPTAILDDLAAKVEARMSRSPQARLDAVRAAVENLAALKAAWQRRRDGAGISEERSKTSLDAEADARQAFREAELLRAAGVDYTTAREIVEGRRRIYEETLARETHARGVEDKTAQALRREAATRQAFKREELLQQVDEDHAQTLSTIYRDFGFWDGPALNFLSRQDKGTRKGVLMSYSKAKRFAGKGAYVNPAMWDGSGELPRILFAGTAQPDVAAQELFSAHPELFPAGTTDTDVTPDMMWEAIGRELRDNKKMMEASKAYQEATRATAEEARAWAEQWETDYKAQLETARLAADAAASQYVSDATNGNAAAMEATEQAAKESRAWRRKAATMQNQDWNSKETLVRAMRTLDAILSAFPAAVRGKVGGWLALARIGTQDRMAAEIDRRITILDRELERELRKDALEELDALRERAKPKREGGKKPTGKLGAEAHRFFARVEEYADLDADEVNAARLTLETLAVDADTPEKAADIFERQQILDQFGGLDARDATGTPLHDAQALAAALAAAEDVYETGRNQWRTQEEARLQDVQGKAQATAAAIGTVTFNKFTKQKMDELTRKAQIKDGAWSLRSSREVLQLLMGRDNPLANEWANRIMDAMHARTDEINALHRRWRTTLEKATGLKKAKADARLWDMSTKRTVSVTIRPGRPEAEPIPIEAIPNLAGLGYSAQEIADAEAAFLALPPDSRAKNVTITRWIKETEEAATLTDAEAVYYSMLWRQDQYTENLNRAGLGEETQAEIEAGMSDAAKGLRQFMADEYAAGYYPLASIFRGMFGVDLPQIPNYAQGRWWHKGGQEKAVDPGGTQPIEGGFRANMLKDRKAHTAKPRLENAFTLFLGHMAQTAHWKAVAPLARELRGVFGSPEVKMAIVANHGPNALGEITRWLDAIEGNGIRTSIPALMQTLMGWRANLMLAYKVSTALKNLVGGTILALYKVSPKEYFRGLGLFVSRQLDVSRIWNSTMIQRRMEGGWSPEVRAAMARTFTDAPTLRRRFVQRGMEIHGYADALGLTLSAAIIYDVQLRQIREAVPGISDAAAEAHAMRQTQITVNQIAQPIEITERSLFELSGLGKVLLSFGSEARQKSSRYLAAWGALLKGKPTVDDWRALLVAHFVAGPVMQFIGNLIMDMRDPDDEEWFDDENWKGMDMLKSVAFGPLAGIPLVRDMADSFRGDSSLLAQANKSFDAAWSAVEGPKAKEDEENKAEWYVRKVLTILKTADSSTGVAASVAEQGLGFIDNAIETREELETMLGKVQRALQRERDPAKRVDLEERIESLKKRLE